MLESGTSTATPVAQRETRIFGVVVLEQRRVIERALGADGYQRVLSRLPDERRLEFAEMGMFSWCSTTTLAMVLTEAARELGTDANTFTARVVREGFGRIMRTVWRLFVSLSDDESIVRRAGIVYTKALDRGKSRAFVESQGHLVLEVSEWPDITPIDMVAIESGIEAAMEVAGRRVSIQTRRISASVVRFDVRTRAKGVTD